ncbi:hypothetical protein EVAR_49241_1 [Eumeta japonica]|uniref:Uncharacterized protein n=1 Tax=Eumeta variegata TaxID=151549 RepID=A0A4C1YG56_EUMVA|nr:hypothetical protein EVAR_49241_1 [Eumeta japonica]
MKRKLCTPNRRTMKLIQVPQKVILENEKLEIIYRHTGPSINAYELLQAIPPQLKPEGYGLRNPSSTTDVRFFCCIYFWESTIHDLVNSDVTPEWVAPGLGCSRLLPSPPPKLRYCLLTLE